MWGRKRVSLGWESGGILCERVLDRPSSNHRGPQTVIWKYLLHRKSFCPDYTEIQIWGTQTFRKGQEQCLSGVCVWGGVSHQKCQCVDAEDSHHPVPPSNPSEGTGTGVVRGRNTRCCRTLYSKLFKTRNGRLGMGLGLRGRNKAGVQQRHSPGHRGQITSIQRVHSDGDRDVGDCGGGDNADSDTVRG